MSLHSWQFRNPLKLRKLVHKHSYNTSFRSLLIHESVNQRRIYRMSPVCIALYDKHTRTHTHTHTHTRTHTHTHTEAANVTVTSLSNEPLDQLTAVQLAKKYPAGYKIGRFIIISTRLSPQASLIHSTPLMTISSIPTYTTE